ncbi:hypothetical protein [Kribbella shirazensis]|uniref:Uncharacterized protein n=1 Tax=Kribbella shirazensis TaxID=1105143 RepID=A0A7X5VB18_9ACTN|nr:hypothetical protein [Kribbella shirazensis]NIK57909.1 hypothetical protein [Kribbella shirazensis]
MTGEQKLRGIDEGLERIKAILRELIAELDAEIAAQKADDQ